MRKLAFVLSAAALALSGTAMAQTAGARALKPDMSRAEAMQRAEAAFARMDANGDGTIDTADKAARQARMFDRIDTDRSGTITQAELAARHADRAERSPKRKMATAMTDTQKAERRAEMFARVDSDKDGALSRTEFTSMHTARGDQRAGAMAHAGKKRAGPRGHHRMMAMAGPVTKQAFVDRALGMFDRADADRNGTVTQAERKAARDAMRQQWQARKAERAG